MIRRPLKSTTAILAALSLLQPSPSFAQSSPDGSVNEDVAQTGEQPPLRTSEEICAEVNIFEKLECGLHILELEAAKVDAAAAAPVEDDATGQAEAEALAAEEAETQAAADAEAQTEASAAAEAEAQATAEAEKQAEASAKAEADAEAQTEASATAEAEAQATAEAEKQAETSAKAEADAAALAAEEEEAQAAADAETETQADDVEQTDTSSSSSSTDDPEACLAEVIAGDGSVVCVDTLTGDSVEALATETDDDTSAEVTTETVTEETSRSSNEEFDEWNPEEQQAVTTQQNAAPRARSRDGDGLSDLQKAGLLALGAAVVGGILLNGQRVEANTGDRVIVVDDNNDYRIFKDDDALLRQPGSDVRTERFSDGSTRSNVMRSDGTEIITIRDSGGRVLRRVLVETDGRQYVLFDDTRNFEPVVVRDLPEPAFDDFDYQAASDRESLRLALLAADSRDIGRSFSLRQVREIHEVRQLSPEISLRSITFATNSSAIQPSQAQELREMGLLMSDLVAEDPTELFLIEGYTDAVGDPGYNLLLSDRRAESVALALSEYFDVPTENMVVQGYGERFLKISTPDPERLNRRVAVRRITTLVREYRALR